MTNTDLAEVWARSLDGLADLQIQPHQRAWLKLTRPLGLVENTALIATPNEFVKEQLETRLRALVTQALSQQLGRDIQLAVTVDPGQQAPAAQREPAADGTSGSGPQPMLSPSPIPTSPLSRSNLYPSSAAPATGLPAPHPPQPAGPPETAPLAPPAQAGSHRHDGFGIQYGGSAYGAQPGNGYGLAPNGGYGNG
ncbi:MAG: chromosomal replication initiator protein DnaA, partial [Streptosporangiaceae bacterium]